MNVAILHYHFDRGGVTRVVESTLAGFADRPAFRFGLLSGRPVGGPDAPARILPDLNYTPPDGPHPDPDALHRGITAAARELFGGRDPDLWHIHNPALGKNSAMCGVVSRLAREGRALLLHEHDFAEDFRPANYRLRETRRSPEDPAFPFSGRVAYGVLNDRDHSLLRQSGLPDHLCHLLPNPVSPVEAAPDIDPVADLLLYPVRALARKNLGEFLLLAHLFRERFRFETTLPPTNPSYRNRFERWKALAQDLALPARLGAAEEDGLSFADRMARSRAIITTSVAEGFGLGFLEPWTFHRPVIGRDLPEVTHSFQQAGIPLDHLYRTFPVPKNALSGDPSASWHKALEGAFREFAVAPDPSEISNAAERLFGGDEVDFALIGEDDQESALRRICSTGIPVSPPFAADPLPDPSAVSTTAGTIRESFAPSRYAARLASIYRNLVNAPEQSPDSLDDRKLLRGFLRPSRFRPHFFNPS